MADIRLGHHAEMALPQMKGGNPAVLGGSPLGQMLEANGLCAVKARRPVFKLSGACSEFVPCPHHAGLGGGWRPKMLLLQISQCAPKLAVTDLVTVGE